jgi:hypothetical protein
MSGGGHIILGATKKALTNPAVVSEMSAEMQATLTPFIGNDPSTWTADNKAAAAAAFSWCILNCT